MSRRKQTWLIIISAVLVIYLFFFPSPTPELAVRKHMLLSFHPIAAFVDPVKTSKGSNIAVVEELRRPFFIVKKNWLGYRVTDNGTGP